MTVKELINFMREYKENIPQPIMHEYQLFLRTGRNEPKERQHFQNCTKMIQELTDLEKIVIGIKF